MDTQAYLSSASFPVEKESEIDPDFVPPDIIIRIAAGVQTDQFESLVKIKPDCLRVAGLSLQDNRPTFLMNRNFFCFIHQPFPNPFSAKRFRYPQFCHHQAI